MIDCHIRGYAKTSETAVLLRCYDTLHCAHGGNLFSHFMICIPIIRFIKCRRMVLLGHVMRMDGGRMPRRILEWKPMGRRIRGRPRKRWIEDAEVDIQTMGIRGWRKLSKERTEWKKIAEKAKTQ